ncbi:uncharacterized protein METZ01_LOCUS510396 [marine metagenome]|uniref:Uncharacterized protein n=1 Tax=marine metagenome TaxID=408172 RepID=A0A383EKU6_9ZZZZ
MLYMWNSFFWGILRERLPVCVRTDGSVRSDLSIGIVPFLCVWVMDIWEFSEAFLA